MSLLKKSSLIAVALFILGTTQCAKERSVTVNSIRPADIEIPSSIKTLLIVDDES